MQNERERERERDTEEQLYNFLFFLFALRIVWERGKRGKERENLRWGQSIRKSHPKPFESIVLRQAFLSFFLSLSRSRITIIGKSKRERKRLWLEGLKKYYRKKKEMSVGERERKRERERITKIEKNVFIWTIHLFEHKMH